MRPLLELPAGKMETGETTRQAADRELAEECGLAVAAWEEIELVRMPLEHAFAALEAAGSVAALGLWMRHYG